MTLLNSLLNIDKLFYIPQLYYILYNIPVDFKWSFVCSYFHEPIKPKFVL